MAYGYDAVQGHAPKPSTKQGVLNGLFWACCISMLIVRLLWINSGQWPGIVGAVPVGVAYGAGWLGAIVAVALFVAMSPYGYVRDVDGSLRFWRFTLGAAIAWDVAAPMLSESFFDLSYAIFALMWIITLVLVPRWWWHRERAVPLIMPKMVAWIPFMLVAVLFVWFGPPVGRLFGGGVHPNSLGALASVGLLACVLARKKLNYIELAIGLSIALMVQARGSFLLMAIFAAFWVLLGFFQSSSGRTGPRWRLTLTLGASLLSVGVLLLMIVGELLPLLDSLFALTDTRRGLGSGLTGRMDYWQQAIAVGIQSPLVGANNTYEGLEVKGHNGYIALIYQFGLVPGALIITAFLARVIKFSTAAVLQPNNATLRTIAAFLGASMIYLVLEPWILDFLKPMGLIVIVLLLYPVPKLDNRSAG